MQHSDKIYFFNFLNQELSIREFEKLIYRYENLEEEIGIEIYLELISWDFQNKGKQKALEDLIYNNIITESEFETWRLKTILIQFINSSENLDVKLNRLYDLYCKVIDREGNIQPGYKFLGNLGLNYFYWMEDGYLKTNYGEEWKAEYEKCRDDFDFYHQQFQPIAKTILKALETNEIQIIKMGAYKISDALKAKLESDEFFQLNHKAKK